MASIPTCDRAVAPSNVCLRTEEDVSIAGEGQAAISGDLATRDAGGIAELEGIDVVLTPDLRQSSHDRVSLGGGASPNGVPAIWRYRIYNTVGDDSAAQDHARTPACVGIAKIAKDVDAQIGQGLAVLVCGEVIPYPQLNGANFSEDLALRNGPRGV